MDWLNKLLSRNSLATRPDDDSNALWLYVQCSRCRTPLAVRVDRRNEISRDYEKGGMILRKEMMDNVCFQLMRAEIQFDEAGRIIAETVEHGKFLTRDEYESLRRPHE